jgi:hypothetical protein
VNVSRAYGSAEGYPLKQLERAMRRLRFDSEVGLGRVREGGLKKAA